jgi:polyhydroxyalkanoate synthesis regulator phasin
MMDVIKKTLLAGVGAAVITKEKVETALDEFVKQGKVSSNEARAMAEKIATDGRREFESMSKDLSEMLRERFAREDKKAQDRINALEARVAALERNAGLGATTTTTTTTGGATVLDASGKAAEPGV